MPPRISRPWSKKDQELMKELCKQGYTPARIAQKMGKSCSSIQVQLSLIPGELAVPGDAPKEQWLRDLPPIEQAKRILGDRYKQDEKDGLHYVYQDFKWHNVPIQELFERAGIKHPGLGI